MNDRFDNEPTGDTNKHRLKQIGKETKNRLQQRIIARPITFERR